VIGEVCFNTETTGFQKILTDPFYAGQMITFSTPTPSVPTPKTLNRRRRQSWAPCCAPPSPIPPTGALPKPGGPWKRAILKLRRYRFILDYQPKSLDVLARAAPEPGAVMRFILGSIEERGDG